ncbi:hypothetical protein AOC36_01035 [Erysipelothrix larvae]|uniref:Thioredoxin domain-containing protein n=1 Tax=Erysipelothrix larvae TaxID=1514105 RepID=A0A109UGI0_9FIRM|nr:hypothetical protein [Erysipelothrix larvae]AMC92626.1 hypothetical protein AOC36_01035 [Erysipelothrix larvae]
MKKQILAFFLVFTLLLTGCANSSNKADLSDYDLLTVTDHNFITGNYEDIMTSLLAKEPGIYFFGYATCAWCRELVPELQEVVSEANLYVNYVDVSDRNNWTLALNNELTEFGSQFEEGAQYEGVPYVIFVGDDGTLAAHVGTLPTHNAQQRLMTDTERAYLQRVLRETIESVGLSAQE